MFGNDMTQDDLRRLYDATIVDQNGDKVGGVGQIYLDDQSDRPTWATAKTGLFGTKETFVPLDEAQMEGSEIRVPYTKDFIKDAPNVDAEHHISEQEEDELAMEAPVSPSKSKRARMKRESMEPAASAEEGSQTSEDESTVEVDDPNADTGPQPAFDARGRRVRRLDGRPRLGPQAVALAADDGSRQRRDLRLRCHLAGPRSRRRCPGCVGLRHQGLPGR